MKKIVMFLIGLFLILSYFVYISYYHIDVTSYTVASEKIQEDVNIVFIADVHDKNCKVKEEIIHQIQDIQPDFILCVGDLLDRDSTNDKDILDFLKQLIQISDVYMSLGNHEFMYYEEHPDHLQHLQDIGVHLLEEAYEDITIHDQTIRIGGMYQIAFGQMKGQITKEDMHNSHTYQFLTEMTDSQSFQIMMAHRPDSFVFCDAYKWDIDLVVSGHNHGGQVILSGVGGIYAPEEKWFPYFDYGHYSGGKMNIIITRGISSGQTIIPRFNNPCEIVNIKLTKKPVSPN